MAQEQKLLLDACFVHSCHNFNRRQDHAVVDLQATHWMRSLATSYEGCIAHEFWGIFLARSLTSLTGFDTKLSSRTDHEHHSTRYQKSDKVTPYSAFFNSHSLKRNFCAYLSQRNLLFFFVAFKLLFCTTSTL